MKRNVDLTEDFDFRRNQFSTMRLSRSVSFRRAFANVQIVDIPYCINNDIEHYVRGGIEQGDSSRRTFIKMICQPVHCECCGRTLKYPWEHFKGLLCPHCDDALERDFSQIPWKRA